MNRTLQFALIFLLVATGPLFLPRTSFSQAQTLDEPVDDPPGQKLFMPLISLSRNYSIYGQVKDTAGEPVEGVTIIDQNGHQSVTKSDGNYRLSNLSPGNYALAPSARGLLFNPTLTEVELASADAVQDFTALTACSDAIVNGGFETNDAWQFPATTYTAGYSTAAAHSGLRSARTGITNPQDNRYSYSSARQYVSIPADVDTALLRVWLYPASGEVFTSVATEIDIQPLPARPSSAELELETLAGDVQYVMILDPGINPTDPVDDTLLETLLWMRSDAQQWQVYDFNVSKYAGRAIKLQVGTYNDGYGGVSALYADDISLELCDDGTLPPVEPPPTPTCQNYIQNASFEYFSDWGIPITTYPASYSTAQAHTGVQSMRTGIVNSAANKYSYSDAYQVIKIPSNATQAILTTYLYMLSDEVTTSGILADPLPEVPREQVFGEAVLAGDVQYVLVLNEYGYVVETLLWKLKDTHAWNYWQFDLLKYRGKIIRLQIGTYNDGGGGITSMYVDDVILDVCSTTTPPTPTPTPPPPGTCTEALLNNGFESSSDWGIPITAYTAGYSTEQAKNGLQSMRTGIVYSAHNRYSYSDAYQLTKIPLSASSATLGINIYQYSTEATTLASTEAPTSSLMSTLAEGGDVQYILLLDWYGNWIDTLYWKRKNTQAWNYHQFDLGRYAGDYIRLQFGTYNDGWGGVTAMYADDASLQVCQ